jgi:hypothetical protein
MSEVVAGVTVVKTEGAVQLISVSFMALFTIGVAAAFFYTLWTRNEVLFTPAEYSGIDIETYVSHVSGRRREREKDIVQQVTETAISQVKLVINTKDNSEIERIDDIATRIRSKFIEVRFDSNRFKCKKDVKFELYADGWHNVSEFLNDIYMKAINEGVDIPIWTYGTYWQLRNIATGDVIAKCVTGRLEDRRPFGDLDISGGTILCAELI